MDYQHERHTVHLVVYHLMWCPKRRRKVLVGPVRNRLEQIIRAIAADHDWTVMELAIQPDHVHPACGPLYAPLGYSTTHEGAELP